MNAGDAILLVSLDPDHMEGLGIEGAIEEIAFPRLIVIWATDTLHRTEFRLDENSEIAVLVEDGTRWKVRKVLRPG